MFEIIWGIIIAIYTFSRKTIENEQYKSKVDSFYEKAHKNIKEIFSNDTKDILLFLSKFSLKITIWSVVIFFFLSLFSNQLPSKLVKIFSSFIITSFLIHFSIIWILKHKETLKEYFLNYHFLIIILAPAIFYLIDNYLHISSDIKLYDIFFPLTKSLGLNLFYVQIVWIIGVFISLYIIPFVLATPIFIVSFILIYLSRKTILSIEKYVNNRNIIDAIFGIIIIATPIVRSIIKNIT